MTRCIVVFSVVIAFLGAGCAAGGSSTGVSLGYALPADGTITVTSRPVVASTLVDGGALFAQAEECGYARSANYYLDLEKLFADQNGAQYTFTIAGNYEMPTWTVTVLPNAASYTDKSLFVSDFDICSAGGNLYPNAMSDAGLLFTSSCGSGYSEGKENGCDVIRKAIEPTLNIE